MIIWIWTGFIAFVLAMLALDLGVINRETHTIGIKEAFAWTTLWIALALAFNVGVYFMYEHHWLGIGMQPGAEAGGRQAALQFLTGYVIEKSLSLDNIFVIALIFSYFRVPSKYQHRVLFWGILGALVLRGVMIAAGSVLIRRFDWIIYVFGALLILTAIRILIVRHDNLVPDRNPLVRLARKLYPVSTDIEGARFFTSVNGRTAITPLFLALLLVESSDVLFAVDSIPAIFAITHDPFLVFTSNIFAILGLRSLYFVLAGIMNRFRYVKISLVFLMAFVGVKMLLSHHYHIPTFVSLVVISIILLVGIVVSVLATNRNAAALVSPLADELEELLTLTYKQARRIVVLVVGTSVLLVGVAMIVLPGPAVIVIPAGLAILATEFVWAKKLLRGAAQRAGLLGKRTETSEGAASDSDSRPD